MSLLAVAVAAAAGALSALFSWYYQPYFAAGNESRFLSEVSPFAAGLFDLRGVAFAAWTLAAFSIGALAGMLIRRVVPAIAATLAAKRAAGVTGAAYAKMAAEMESMRQSYANPLMRMPMTFMEIFPVGLVVAIVSAALLRNARFLPARSRPVAA